jgi:ribosomal protein L20A (L18A)
MKTYKVEASETVSYERKVKANSKEEAWEKAWGAEYNVSDHAVDYLNLQIDNVYEIENEGEEV